MSECMTDHVVHVPSPQVHEDIAEMIAVRSVGVPTGAHWSSEENGSRARASGFSSLMMMGVTTCSSFVNSCSQARHREALTTRNTTTTQEIRGFKCTVTSTRAEGTTWMMVTIETDPGWPTTMPSTVRPQDRPDLKFASMRVCCAMAKPSMRDMECVKRIGRYLVGKPRAKCWFRWQQSGDLEAHSDADWRGDRATRRSVSAGVIMRRSRCLKVWTKKQQVVALSSAESELFCCSQDGLRRARDPKPGEGHGNILQTEPALGCLGNDVPSQTQGTGQGEAS